jgi:hypothetical protein
MNTSIEDFRRHFDMLSDEALLATSRDDLTDTARLCYDEEVTRRGLNAPESAAEEGAAAHQASGDEEVIVATYAFAEEASLALGLLRSAGIPARIATEYVAMGPSDFRLMVPADSEEHALEILGDEISEEDLAAQAEAAGMPEDE